MEKFILVVVLATLYFWKKSIGYYKNENTSFEENSKDVELDEEWLEYYKSGKIKIKGYYKSGKKEGK